MITKLIFLESAQKTLYRNVKYGVSSPLGGRDIIQNLRETFFLGTLYVGGLKNKKNDRFFAQYSDPIFSSIFVLILSPIFGSVYGLILGLIFGLIFVLIFGSIFSSIFSLIWGPIFGSILARACGVPVGRRSGG